MSRRRAMSKNVEDTKSVDATPVEAAPVPLLDEASSESVDSRVRRWVAQNLSNGRIARDTDMWNELQTALPALVAIIEA